MANIKVRISLVTTIVLVVINESYQLETNIWKVEGTTRRNAHREQNDEIGYENPSENMLPLLSRDMTLLEHAIDMIDNKVCRSQCKLVMAGMHNLTIWAAKFYDSSGKFPEGVLGTSLYQLGHYDECLEIGNDDGAPTGISGQYCLGEVGIKVPDSFYARNDTIWEVFKPSAERNQHSISKLHWGICVPSGCKPRDVEDVLKTILAVAFSGSQLQLTPRIPSEFCYKNTPLVANNLDIAYISLILGFICLGIVGTAFDVIYHRRRETTRNGLLCRICMCFSFKLNLKKLCANAQDHGVNLSCVAGIKVLAMVIIIMGHTLMFTVSGPVENESFWTQAVTKIENSAFLNNPLLVDTFLLLSGFLATSLILSHLHKGQSVNFLFVYLLRYIRLTPAYLVVIGFYVTWLPKLDSGPMWYRIELEKERCQASWWTNILYVNNYVNTDQLCAFQSWYLSVDTQLFVLAPLVIYPLHKWRRFGEVLLAGVTIVSIVVPFVITLRDKLDPTLLVYSSEIKDISSNEFFKTSYIKTHMRACSYCFGMVCGYLIHRIQISGHKFSKSTVRVGWFLAAVLLISSMFSIVVFYGPRKNFAPIESAIYASMHRLFWSLGTGWVLIACITSNGGPVAKLLKWKPFISMSRLTYSAYLVNGMVELHSVSTVKSPLHLDTMTLTCKALAHVLLTFSLAFVLSMMFESPILRLEKVLLRPERRDKNKDSRKDDSEETDATEA